MKGKILSTAVAVFRDERVKLTGYKRLKGVKLTGHKGLTGVKPTGHKGLNLQGTKG